MSSSRTPLLAALIVADDPDTWSSLGFTVTDDRVRIGATDLLLAGAAAGRGILGWRLGGADAVALPPSVEGLPTTTDPAASSAVAPAHPNGVVSIDHLVVLTPLVERTVATLEGLGLPCRRRRAGAAYGQQQMVQAFFWLGDPDGPAEARVILEVVGPEEPDPLRADEPARFFGLALTSQDLDATGARLGDLMKPPVPAVQEGRMITTISSRCGSSVAIALMSAHP